MSIVPTAESIKQGWWVDRKVYFSEEVFQLERERIFAKTWHFACLVTDVKNPGDFFSMSVINQPILIVRDGEGQLGAFFNSCTHRGAMLTHERSGNCGRLFRCMYHAWAFSLKGELLGVPYVDAYGPDFDRKDFALHSVRCETFCNLVFVTLNPKAPPLIDYLGEIADVLSTYATGIEVIARNSWVYDGNWKLWHENFRDNYHPQFAHRGINDATPHYADRGGNWALAPGHSLLRWISEKPNVTSYKRSMKRYSGVEFPEAGNPSLTGGNWEYREAPQDVLAIFPNMDMQPGMASTEPGQRGSRMGHIQTLTPLSPHRTRVDYIAYSSTDDDPVTRQAMLEGLAENQGSWGKISCDDVEAAVRCHAGVQAQGTQYTPFTRGIKPGKGGADVDPRDEYSLREFYRVYTQYLEGDVVSEASIARNS